MNDDWTLLGIGQIFYQDHGFAVLVNTSYLIVLFQLVYADHRKTDVNSYLSYYLSNFLYFTI